ncbi:hypothetical protein BDV32DRAFT_146524 [Aspergillus pseudonomiae]|nr:hypothetical protein BDV32DRAFT_146524 [Aspergillus pseudonomiae]
MLQMISWGGRSGEKDEPQHNLIGPNILNNIEANNIPYQILPGGLSRAQSSVGRLVARAKQDNTPVLLLTGPVKREYDREHTGDAEVQRYLRLFSWGQQLRPVDAVQEGQSIARNFCCIGAMGHTYALAHWVSNGCRANRVVCIGGDGSIMMHLGNNTILSPLLDQTVIHIVIYNGMHSSTGNQPLMIGRGDLLALVEGLPYERKLIVNTADGVKKALRSVHRSALILVPVNDDTRKSLPRPTETPTEQKHAFMGSFGSNSKL